MSRFVNRTATDLIKLSNGDQVWVRQKLTAAETASLDKNLVRMEIDSAAEPELDADGKPIPFKPRMVAGDWHLQRIEVCRAYITAWDFEDDGGKAVPYKADLIGELDGETVDEIATAIDKLQDERKQAAQKKVSMPSGK